MVESAPFAVGMSRRMRRTVTAADVETFAEVTGDENPVHLDEAYAAKTRFHHRIAHGMLAASYISALLGTTFPGPGTIYVSQGLSFLRPVYLGDQLEIVATVRAYRPEKALLTLETAVYNQHGEKVVGGEAVCLVSDVAGAGAAATACSGAAAD